MREFDYFSRLPSKEELEIAYNFFANNENGCSISLSELLGDHFAPIDKLAYCNLMMGKYGKDIDVLYSTDDEECDFLLKYKPNVKTTTATETKAQKETSMRKLDYCGRLPCNEELEIAYNFFAKNKNGCSISLSELLGDHYASIDKQAYCNLLMDKYGRDINIIDSRGEDIYDDLLEYKMKK